MTLPDDLIDRLDGTGVTPRVLQTMFVLTEREATP